MVSKLLDGTSPAICANSVSNPSVDPLSTVTNTPVSGRGFDFGRVGGLDAVLGFVSDLCRVGTRQLRRASSSRSTRCNSGMGSGGRMASSSARPAVESDCDRDRLRLRLRLRVDFNPRIFLANSGRRVGTLEHRMAPFISTTDQRAASVLSQEGSRGSAARWRVRTRATESAQTLGRTRTRASVSECA